MESLLLAVDVDAPDPEQLNAIFPCRPFDQGFSRNLRVYRPRGCDPHPGKPAGSVAQGRVGSACGHDRRFPRSRRCLAAIARSSSWRGCRRRTGGGDGLRDRLKSLTSDAAAVAPDSKRSPAPSCLRRPKAAICFRLDPGLGDPNAAAESLLDELRDLGEVNIAHRPTANSADHWVLHLHGSADADDIASIVGFVASVEGQRIVPLSAPYPERCHWCLWVFRRSSKCCVADAARR